MVKWMFVAGLVMYVAFSVIIVRQVGVMTEAIEDDINGIISLFAWVHLLLAIALVVWPLRCCNLNGSIYWQNSGKD